MKKLSSLLVLLYCMLHTFAQTQQDTLLADITDIPVSIDGKATEECWENAEWHSIDQVWIPYNTNMKPGDFEGRFKMTWDREYLYLLVEVVDDSLSDDHSDPYTNWWDDDCLEIFIDEDRSMGNHERSCNAFAYHVSLTYDALDLNSSGNGVNYKDNLEVVMDTLDKNTYLWELAVKMYDASFILSNPESSRIYLEKDKLMGFAIAYCDNDETTSRENFIGSMYMTDSHFNDMYINADYFGPMRLRAPESTLTAPKKNSDSFMHVYPVPAKHYIMVETSGAGQSLQSVSISSLTGQLVKKFTVTGSSFSLDIKLLDPGFYLLQVHGSQGSHTQLILKE